MSLFFGSYYCPVCRNGPWTCVERAQECFIRHFERGEYVFLPPKRPIFEGCRFCEGAGCLACPGERERAIRRSFEHPLFIFELVDTDSQAAESDMVAEGCPNNHENLVMKQEDKETMRRIIGSSPDAIKTGDPFLDVHMNILVEMLRRKTHEAFEHA